MFDDDGAGDGDQEDDNDDDGVHLMNPPPCPGTWRVYGMNYIFPDLPLHAFFAMLYVRGGAAHTSCTTPLLPCSDAGMKV